MEKILTKIRPTLDNPKKMGKILLANAIFWSVFWLIFTDDTSITRYGFWPFTTQYGLFDDDLFLIRRAAYYNFESFRQCFQAFLSRFDYIDLLFYGFSPIILYLGYYLFMYLPNLAKRKVQR